MPDEQTNTSVPQGNETNTPTAEGATDPAAATAPKNLVEQAREENAKLEVTLKAITEEREKLEKLKSEEALGGAVGGNIPAQQTKDETPKEYRARINKELAEGKYDRKSG